MGGYLSSWSGSTLIHPRPRRRRRNRASGANIGHELKHAAINGCLSQNQESIARVLIEKGADIRQIEATEVTFRH